MSPPMLSFLLMSMASAATAQTCQTLENEDGEGACLLQGYSGHAERVEVAEDQMSDVDEVSESASGRRRRRSSSTSSSSASTQEIDKIKARLDKVEKTVGELAKGKAAPAAPAAPSRPAPPSTLSRRRGASRSTLHRRRSASKKKVAPKPTPKGEVGGGAPSAAEGKVPTSVTDRWINAHNYWRCVHNTGPIIWDANIAKGAQQWVDEGHSGHADCYNLPNPLGPTGENIAGGTRLSPEMASAMWHDESPERGPNCGGHCTAMLWKSANKLGCGLKKPTGGGMMAMTKVVCRYGGGTPLNKRLAANFGGSSAKRANVKFPDNSRAALCKKKWPPAKGFDHKTDSREPSAGGGGMSSRRGRKGGGGMGGFDDFFSRRRGRGGGGSGW